MTDNVFDTPIRTDAGLMQSMAVYFWYGIPPGSLGEAILQYPELESTHRIFAERRHPALTDREIKPLLWLINTFFPSQSLRANYPWKGALELPPEEKVKAQLSMSTSTIEFLIGLLPADVHDSVYKSWYSSST